MRITKLNRGDFSPPPFISIFNQNIDLDSNLKIGLYINLWEEKVLLSLKTKIF
jgi:hypothetical protein